MLPIPTGTAVLVFFGLVGMLAAGLTTQSAPTIALASGGFVGVGLVLAATMPLGRRLRRQRLEFAWWLDHGTGVASGAAVPHSPFVVRCYVRHRGAEAITVEALEPLWKLLDETERTDWPMEPPTPSDHWLEAESVALAADWGDTLRMQVYLEALPSRYGHDAFLVSHESEANALRQRLSSFLAPDSNGVDAVRSKVQQLHM